MRVALPLLRLLVPVIDLRFNFVNSTSPELAMEPEEDQLFHLLSRLRRLSGSGVWIILEKAE